VTDTVPARLNPRELAADQVTNRIWTVRCDDARHMAGVYFYRLKAGEWQSTRKMVVVR